MRKLLLLACLFALPSLSGCSVMSALLEGFDWDFGSGTPKSVKTQEDRRKVWEWESSQYQN